MQDGASGVGVGDTLAFLAGRWSTRRELLDRTTGVTGIFTGITAFTPDGDGLRWDEEGTVAWPHFEGPASRSYRISAAGAVATVHFAPVEGDVPRNRTRMVALATEAARAGARIIVFPEMATSGYSFFSRSE